LTPVASEFSGSKKTAKTNKNATQPVLKIFIDASYPPVYCTPHAELQQPIIQDEKSQS
jgi:hypothetical protein